MPQIYDIGPTALLPLRRKTCWGFFRLKIRRLRPGLNPQTWVLIASTLSLNHRSRIQFMHWIKNMLQSLALYCQILIWFMKRQLWQDLGGSCSDKLAIFSELHQEKYMPHARDNISQLQTSALQRSLAKIFAVIRNTYVFLIVVWICDKNGM